eukprot:292638_1
MKMRKESTGPVCLVQQPDKTQKEQHRRAVHRGNVGQEIDDDDFQVDPLPLYDVVGEEALGILGKRNELYLVNYGTSTEWTHLSPDSALVKEYEKERVEGEQKSNDSDELPVVTREMMKDWMHNRLPDEIIVEEDCFTII